MKIYQQFCLYSICVLVLSSATSSIGKESPVLDEPFGYDVLRTWDECVDMDENGWVGNDTGALSSLATEPNWTISYFPPDNRRSELSIVTDLLGQLPFLQLTSRTMH
ncbi:MAG: hypothetical protein OXO49_01700 [Gammaproteobacteria bacterium]|nr:hypothetical protein [Gammaproteobacteria bacterium]MDE0252536.1 hypothetical protein [Gammaproteobacteria bacterium]MDE0402980.1 hypothetical protein [Gammaproteobacteria bacterium]